MAAGCALVGMSIALAVGADPQPWTEQPFLGLSVRDGPHGPVVAWVRPGPLGGTGYHSAAGVQRADNIVEVNGAPITAAAEFERVVAGLRPGQLVRVRFRRAAEADARAAVPGGGAGGELHEVEVVIASRDEWTGTLGRGWGERSILPAPAPGEFEAQLRAVTAGLHDGAHATGLDELVAYLGRVQDAAPDPNALSWVVRCFRNPLRVIDVESELAVHVQAAAAAPSPDTVAALLHAALDIEPLRAMPEDRRRAALETLHAARDEWVEVTTAQPGARQLVRTMRDSMSPGGEHAAGDIRVIRRAGETAADLLRWHLDRLPWAWSEVERHLSPHALAAPRQDVPDDIRRAAQGDILFWERRGGDTVNIVGGDGPNTYDMSVINWVYDLGGNDTYRFPQRETDAIVNERIIIDLTGDDTYEGDGDFAGPGVGVFACGIIDDRDGRDTYRTTGQCAAASGLLGIGIILDHRGDDTYENRGPRSGWSLGAGFYGAGLIIDRAGDDVYTGEKLVQGVGGPRGFGAIIDVAGDDSYSANGPNFPSAYGTPNTFLSLSQGFGFGVRGYAAGGVGAIYDLSGNDRYGGGEFSQGGAYFFALGILHDASGRDRYEGSRYNQGFSAHQAIGILVDDAGDDVYRGHTAASQAGAWDQSIAWLVDRAGNDVYHCDGLGQGAASMQALAVFLDLGGDDTYTAAAAGSVQGESGSNTYHFDKDGTYSFSMLLDLGQGRDRYSAPKRADGVRRATGDLDPDRRVDSPWMGVFVDEGPVGPEGPADSAPAGSESGRP